VGGSHILADAVLHPPGAIQSPPITINRYQARVVQSLQALQTAVATKSNLPHSHCAHILAELDKLKVDVDNALAASQEANQLLEQIQVQLREEKSKHTACMELNATLLKAIHQSFGKLTWENFKSDYTTASKHINGLTSCRSVRVLESLYDMLNIAKSFEQLRLRHNGLDYDSQSCRINARSLTTKDFMFMTLMRLWTGMSVDDLAWLFGVSSSVISRVFETVVLHMYHCFKALFPPPTLDMREKTMPAQFLARLGGRGGYIIDCSDIECQVGSDPQVQYATYSDYHHFTGIKFLAAYTFCGGFAFASHGMCARASDNAVTEISGFLDILEKGDTVVADRGFTIFYLLGRIGVTLYIPPFRKKDKNKDTTMEKDTDEKLNGYQYSSEDSQKTSKIANLRIHVERGFERTKKFKIFDRPVPMGMLDLATPMFYVCSMLTNMQLPLVANLKSNSYTKDLISVSS
jgi:hypothetical protein